MFIIASFVFVCGTFDFVNSYGITECLSLDNAVNEKFDTLHQWRYLNYTWPGRGDAYMRAVRENRYSPVASVPVGVKYHNDRLYMSIPRLSVSSPVTFAWVPLVPVEHYSSNQLLRPYPSWEMNQLGNCRALQNVHGFEIDRKGILWVLDARRMDGTTNCPPRIVFLDTNQNGRVVGEHLVFKEVCNPRTCFLNDIVVDEFDGGWAYMTNTDEEDPGLVVYSKRLGRSWKVRDTSTMAELPLVGFVAHGVPHPQPTPVDGIALTPQRNLDDPKRKIFYTSLTGLSMWSIDTDVLRKAATSNKMIYPKLVGSKLGPSDGMVIDSVGNLYYGVLTDDSVAKWQTSYGTMNETNQQIVDRNSNLIIWPDTFAFDTFGTLYVIANNVDKFIQQGMSTEEVNFRILRLYTATCGYQFK